MAGGDDIFATTRWTLVSAAGDGSEGGAEALETLCSIYWMPIYAFIRHRGFGREDAEDLTQGFFAMLLERNDFAGLDRERGKFRAFLLVSLKHYLANERDKAKRLKRGGGFVHLSLDWEAAEAKVELRDELTISPDEVFDRLWALTLLAQVMGRLKEEQKGAGKERQFEVLRPFLTVSHDEGAIADAAAALEASEGAVRVAAHRLRKRYRELLKAEIGRTLSAPEMVEGEMAVLLRAFAEKRD